VPDDGELQAVEANHLVDGAGAAAVHAARQLIGKQRDLLALRHVALV